MKNGTLSTAWVIALLLAGAGYRIAVPIFDLPLNTAPLMAMAFGGALLSGGRTWWLPILVLVSSDLILGFILDGGGVGAYTLVSGVFFALVAWLGSLAGKRNRSFPMMWCGTLLAGIAFYVLANTYSWLVLPGYDGSLAGWWQSQTTGLPGYSPPAWVFLRNALIADTLWCVLAGLAYSVFSRPLPVAVGAASR